MKYSETLALMNYHALLPMPLEMCHHSKEQSICQSREQPN